MLLLFLSWICSRAQGQDSVGSALAFSLFELARHPHVQELAVQELYDVFGDDQRVPSLSDLGRLTYLDQCIKETLRMYPSVPLIFRTLTQDAKLGTARVNGQSADEEIFTGVPPQSCSYAMNFYKKLYIYTLYLEKAITYLL